MTKKTVADTALSIDAADQPSETPVQEVPTTEVLVLCDYCNHRAGHIAIIPTRSVQAAVDYGWADPHPAAVAAGKANQA